MRSTLNSRTQPAAASTPLALGSTTRRGRAAFSAPCKHVADTHSLGVVPSRRETPTERLRLTVGASEFISSNV